MSKKQTRIPDNHVVGVLHDDQEVDAAVSEAQQAGYADLLVLRHIEAGGAGAQSLSALLERVGGHLRDQPAYLEQYRRETDHGGAVMAVKVADPDEADETRQLMERHGATSLRFFGRFAAADMMRVTNPPASDRA